MDSITSIDNIFTTEINKRITNGVIADNLISDHFPVFALVKSSSPACQKSYVRKRKVTAGRIEKLRDELANVAWSNIKTGNTNTSYNEFIKIYMGLVDKHIPIQHVKQKEDTATNKPWLTKGIKISCATKKKLFKKELHKTNRIIKYTRIN